MLAEAGVPANSFSRNIPPKAHILISSGMRGEFCSICPMFVPFFPFFCAVCLIFIVKSGYLTDIDAFGAFRHEEDFLFQGPDNYNMLMLISVFTAIYSGYGLHPEMPFLLS